jgi:hypothetical protein
MSRVLTDEQKARKRERMAGWREANKERLLAYQKLYRAENKDSIVAYQAASRSRRLQVKAEYRRRNAVHIKAANRRYKARVSEKKSLEQARLIASLPPSVLLAAIDAFVTRQNEIRAAARAREKAKRAARKDELNGAERRRYKQNPSYRASKLRSAKRYYGRTPDYQKFKKCKQTVSKKTGLPRAEVPDELVALRLAYVSLDTEVRKHECRQKA